MNKNRNPGNGKIISDIVQDALQSGDLTRLKDLGPAVQQVVSNISGVKVGAQSGSTPADNARPVGRPVAPVAPVPPGPPVQGINPAWRQPRGNTLRISRSLPQIILSSLGVFVSGLFTLIFLGLSSVSLKVVFVPLSAVFGASTLACAGFLGAGIGKRRLAGRIIRLATLFQRKKVYTFKELAAETGLLPKQIKRDLRKARARGMAPDIRTDAGETCVMWGEDIYRQYLETEKFRLQEKNEAEERQRRLQDPVAAGIDHFRSEGEATVQKIRAANAAIPGEEISARLHTLEDITARIFACVERYPEKLPDTRRFMNYYLPTTLKLVEKYRQYDEMDFQPENVRQAKLDIERSLDTINLAFSNLLESLFAHDTLDVATDIDVLEKMLEQEGLTGRKFRIDPAGNSGSARPD